MKQYALWQGIYEKEKGLLIVMVALFYSFEKESLTRVKSCVNNEGYLIVISRICVF